MTEKFSLKKEFPEFASELKQLLERYPNLQKQIDELEAFERCRCSEISCATIYTSPPPKGAWGKEHENIMLDPSKGMIILDILRGKIVCIEILDRKEFRQKLLILMPEKTDNERLTTNN